MAGISSLGVGSGLDLSGLLKNLMAAEQQPLFALQTKEATYQSKISALGTLKSALSSLQTSAEAFIPKSTQTLAQKYAKLSASVADSSIASASASSSAVPGTYALEVSQLAKSQRLATTTPGGVSPFSNADATIAQGVLQIDFGSLAGGVYTEDTERKLEITIDSSNDTLAGLRDAINKANSGVSATIVTGSAGAQLVLTAKESGTENVMRLSGLTGFAYDPELATGDFTQDEAQGGQAAQNAEFTINGIAASSSSNKVSDVLDGVTLTLAKTTLSGTPPVSTPTTITVSQDSTSQLTSVITGFIKSFNEANNTIKQLGAYDPETKAAGQLQGQAIVRSSQSQIRNLIFNTSLGGDSSIQRLSDIGISLSKTGELTLDSTKLNKALAENFDDVTALAEKVGSAFKTTLERVTGSAGTITSMTDNIKDAIKNLESRAETLSLRLTRVEERYRAQFSSLDTLIAGMNQTSTYLSQQLASISKIGES